MVGRQECKLVCALQMQWNENNNFIPLLHWDTITSLLFPPLEQTSKTEQMFRGVPGDFSLPSPSSLPSDWWWVTRVHPYLRGWATGGLPVTDPLNMDHYALPLPSLFPPWSLPLHHSCIISIFLSSCLLLLFSHFIHSLHYSPSSLFLLCCFWGPLLRGSLQANTAQGTARTTLHNTSPRNTAQHDQNSTA